MLYLLLRFHDVAGNIVVKRWPGHLVAVELLGKRLVVRRVEHFDVVDLVFEIVGAVFLCVRDLGFVEFIIGIDRGLLRSLGHNEPPFQKSS
ncbi:hypothetical protein [Roseovarius sp. D22-M7]|uniref:hypothetical protein n=1 Tax=Roseovarius sp. D22-M7 TaxID=3127116 RepID=UPI00300FEC35